MKNLNYIILDCKLIFLRIIKKKIHRENFSKSIIQGFRNTKNKCYEDLAQW